MRISSLFFLVMLACRAQGAATDPRLVRSLLFEPGSHQGEYLSQGGRTSLFLSRSGIDFRPDNVRLTLVGGLPVDPEGTDIQTSVSNYFLGNDSAKWRTGVANYGKVRYAGVYPGVDLLVYGSERSFEYDFVVAPHADASRIRMRFDGTKNVRLNTAGDLLIGEGGLMQRRPRVFQEGREIAGGFRVERDRSVSFDLGAYDHSLPLTIDPVISYISYLGGNAADIGESVAVDKAGNVYVAGWATSSDFPGLGAFGRAEQIQFGFVSKYAPITSAKAQLLYTIFLGDAFLKGGSIAYAVTTDASGNVIVAGLTNAAGFPTRNAAQPALSGGLDCTFRDGGRLLCQDGFVSKFTPDGRTLIFSTFYGGAQPNYFVDVAVDTTGGIYAIGFANGPTDLKGTPGAVQPTAQNGVDMQVVRFDPTGKLLYATYLGGLGADLGKSIAVEKPGVVWIGGTTGSQDMPMPAMNNGVLTSFVGKVLNGYIARLDMNQSGAAGLTYASYFRGTDSDTNTGLVKLFLDPSGQVVFCGSTSSNIPLTANRMQNFVGAPVSRITGPNFIAGDAYIARLNPAVAGLAGLTYSSYVGGTDSDSAFSCGLDPKGNFVVTGTTYSTDLFLAGGSPIPFKLTTGAKDGINIFLIRIDPTRTGGKIDSFLTGGTDNDGAFGMAIDSQGFAYITGQTFSKQFPTTSNAQQRTYGGDDLRIDPPADRGDSYLMQVDLNSAQVPATQVIQESGDFQFAMLGSVLASPISVRIADAQGHPLNLSGYPIEFTATNGALVSPNLALTDGSGIAGTNVRLAGGDATIVANVGLEGFKSYTFHAKAINGTVPQSVAIVSGDKQSGKGGATLAQPLVVELRGANNSPLALGGLTVQFKTVNATVGSTTVVTNASGRASITVTLGTEAASPSVQVIVGSLAVTATFSITSPAISAGGVVSAATFKGSAVSAGLIVTLFGSNIGPATLVSNAAGGDGKFSTLLAGTRVLFDGIASPMIYASAGQTSAIVPYEVAGKTSTLVTVEYQGTVSAAQTVAVASAQLGLFSANASGSGPGAILNQDNSVNSESNPARRNSIVVLFGTGEGQTDPPGVNGQLALSIYPKPKAPITVKINGIPAEVLYYGAAPTLVAGVLQINVRIPAGAGDGPAIVEIFEGSNQSPATITVAVKGDS